MASPAAQLVVARREALKQAGLRQRRRTAPPATIRAVPRALVLSYASYARKVVREVAKLQRDTYDIRTLTELQDIPKPDNATNQRYDVSPADLVAQATERITEAIPELPAVKFAPIMIESQAQKVNVFSEQVFNKQAQSVLGFNRFGGVLPNARTDSYREDVENIAVQLFGSEPWLDDTLKTFANENARLLKNLTAKQVSDVEGVILRGLQAGQRSGNMAKDIAAITNRSLKQANAIARDQTTKLHGSLTQLRQTDAGVDGYIWRTSLDDLVRDPVHTEREGVRFSWSKPPFDGHPGQPINCRCHAEPDFSNLLGIPPEVPPKPTKPSMFVLPKKPKPPGPVFKPATPSPPITDFPSIVPGFPKPPPVLPLEPPSGSGLIIPESALAKPLEPTGKEAVIFASAFKQPLSKAAAISKAKAAALKESKKPGFKLTAAEAAAEAEAAAGAVAGREPPVRGIRPEDLKRAAPIPEEVEDVTDEEVRVITERAFDTINLIDEVGDDLRDDIIEGAGMTSLDKAVFAIMDSDVLSEIDQADLVTAAVAAAKATVRRSSRAPFNMPIPLAALNPNVNINPKVPAHVQPRQRAQNARELMIEVRNGLVDNDDPESIEEAIAAWTGGSTGIQTRDAGFGFTRKGERLRGGRGVLDGQVESLRMLLNNAPLVQPSTTVYRGMGNMDQASWIQYAKKGNVIVQDRLESMTLDPNKAIEFMKGDLQVFIEVNPRAGSDNRTYDTSTAFDTFGEFTGHNSEFEVLSERGNKYRVLEVEQSGAFGRTLNVKLEEL